MSYVSDPEVLSDFGATQRTRLPSQVLQSKNAQCLEGTILFATLMEAVGLHPILVRVPHHAFVGWHAVAEDGAGDQAVFFIETTAVHDATFEQSLQFAKHTVDGERAAGHFGHGIEGLAYMLEVSELRREGFKPQPQD
jgi:hypothetical protein